jgi:hypothetical protein
MVLEEADLDLWLLRGAVYISRTIVVTAMSGVAANLLIGETTHLDVREQREVCFCRVIGTQDSTGSLDASLEPGINSASLQAYR